MLQIVFALQKYGVFITHAYRLHPTAGNVRSTHAHELPVKIVKGARCSVCIASQMMQMQRNARAGYVLYRASIIDVLIRGPNYNQIQYENWHLK